MQKPVRGKWAKGGLVVYMYTKTNNAQNKFKKTQNQGVEETKQKGNNVGSV